MYLPYSVRDKMLHCVLNSSHDKPGSSLYSKSNYKGASYIIKWTEPPAASAVLNARFTLIRSKGELVWNTIFKEKTDDLCGQVKKATANTELTRKGAVLCSTDDPACGGFTAVVAVRCAFEFVWYELGWRYYEAAATTSEYVLSRYDGEYNDACGQLIFLS